MVYRITSGELRDYVYGRVTCPPLPGQVQFLLNAKSLGDSTLQLWAAMRGDINNLTCLFSYEQGSKQDYVEI